MATYDLLRDLPVVIESYELHGLSQRFGPEFERLTTEIVLKGGGEEGRGEDVIYDGLDHIALRDAGPLLDLLVRAAARRARPLSDAAQSRGVA